LTFDPKNVIRRCNYAAVLIELKQTEEGMALCRELLSEQPENLHALRNLIRAYRDSDRREEALDLCGQDLQGAHGMRPEILVERAYVYSRQGALDNALADCAAALASDAKNIEAVLAKGVLHWKKRQYKAALKSLEQAQELDLNASIAGIHPVTVQLLSDKQKLRVFRRFVKRHTVKISLTPPTPSPIH
jgi:tetratricopeptide (TPR) repeat protein